MVDHRTEGRIPAAPLAVGPRGAAAQLGAAKCDLVGTACHPGHGSCDVREKERFILLAC